MWPLAPAQRIMAASAPVLATAATAARVPRPRPRRRVSRRRDPRPVRATEPNQADVEASSSRREIERPQLEPKLAEAREVATRRSFSHADDSPALAAKVGPPAEPVRWPLVHARSVEALARVLANPGTDAQKVMRQALRAQYRPRGSLVYDENDPARWPGSDAPTNAERGAIADAVLASEVNRLRLAYLAHLAAMDPDNITVPKFGRAALWAVLCDQEIADACEDDLPPDELSYLDAADAMIAAHWAGLDDDTAGDDDDTVGDAAVLRDTCFDAAKLRAIRAVVADADSTQWPADPATALAARRSVPTWLAAKLIDQHGADVADRVAASLLRKAPMFGRLNRAKQSDVQSLLGRLRNEGVESVDMTQWQLNLGAEAEERGEPRASVITTPAAGAPDAIVFPKNRSPFRLDSWREGWFEIQDAGSQAVARAAVDAVGESSVSSRLDETETETETRRRRGRRVRVLDMCAGNGGKTLAMASELSRRVDVGTIDGYVIDAFDVDARRLRHLESNAERAGVAGNVRVVSFEKMRDAARVGNGERSDGRVDVADPRYDLVLCDAPCSSTGAMRRTPSMRWLIAGDVAEWKEGAQGDDGDDNADSDRRDPLRYSTAWGDGDGDGVFAEVDVDALGDTAGENGRNGSSPVTDGSRGTRDDLSLPEVQRRILAKAAGLCRPNGGALVYATCSLLREENECVRAWFDTRFGDDFVPVPFEAHWPLAPDDVTGDVDEGDVARDDVDEDGNAMDDGTVAPSHGFALRPDLHGCDGFYVARWVRKPEPGWEPG